MEEIDIKKIFETMWEKKVIMLLIILVILLIGIIYTFLIKKPLYISTAKILLEKNEMSASELLKSDEVLNQVKANLGIEVSLETLRGQIQSKYNKETRVMQITCTSEDSSYSNKVVRETVNIYTQELEELLQLKNTKLLQEAEQANSAYNINHIKDLLITAVIGCIILGAYIFIVTLKDNTIKGRDMIENLDMKVLGIVPEKMKEGK